MSPHCPGPDAIAVDDNVRRQGGRTARRNRRVVSVSGQPSAPCELTARRGADCRGASAASLPLRLINFNKSGSLRAKSEDENK